jgi:fused signal recognition particle receptor
MDPSSAFTAADLYQLAAIVGGVGVTGALGLLFVRRARAARRRQIDSVGEAPEPLARPKKARSLPEAEEAEEAKAPKKPEETPRTARPQGAGTATARAPESRPTTPEAPRRLPEPAAAKVEPEPRPEAKSAQVIPFPVPAPTAPTRTERIERAPQPRDASALAPGLARTRSSGFIARLGQILSGRKELDPSIVDEIEKVLLTADIGVKTSQKLLEEIRGSLTRRELKDPDAVWAFLRQRSAEMLAIPAPEIDFSSARPFVLLVVGVNGSGKTTTIGKLAAKLSSEGKRVLLAAGDTFRAAAAEQLEIWSGRSQATLVRGKEGADPSSVIFDGVKRAVTEGFDVAIADTAGRLHTKTDLMQELQKIRRVIGKASAGAPHETWLVIDATSGQNAIAQAQIFTGDLSVTGIVLTKLDGTAKGGVILGIADQLKIPVRYVGVGERVEDLRRFDPEEFVEALFAPPGN